MSVVLVAVVAVVTHDSRFLRIELRVRNFLAGRAFALWGFDFWRVKGKVSLQYPFELQGFRAPTLGSLLQPCSAAH